MYLNAINPRLRLSLSALTLSLLMGAAHAEAPRQNALSFSASATEEVTQDLLVVTLQAWWLLRDPSLFATLGSPSELENYAQRDFVAQCALPEDEFYADAFVSEADKHP